MRHPLDGAVAQLGERVVRNDEVRGSIPLSSTTGGLQIVELIDQLDRRPFCPHFDPHFRIVVVMVPDIPSLPPYPSRIGAASIRGGGWQPQAAKEGGAHLQGRGYAPPTAPRGKGRN